LGVSLLEEETYEELEGRGGKKQGEGRRGGGMENMGWRSCAVG